jgi:hypothetical protein
MDELYTQLLDDFFNGLLDAEGRQRVHDLVEQDAEFAREYRLREKMNDFLRMEAQKAPFVAGLNHLSAEFFPAHAAPALAVTHRRFRWTRALLAAAAVFLLALAAWWLLRPPADLYQQYAQHQRPSFQVRGTSDALLQEAETAFQQHQYAQAAQALEPLYAAHPEDAMLGLYLGICRLETQQYPAARQVLEPIAVGNSSVKNEALWYLALTDLREGKKADCAARLQQIPASDFRYRQARELREKLK